MDEQNNNQNQYSYDPGPQQDDPQSAQQEPLNGTVLPGQTPPTGGNEPGKGAATASLVLGIIAVVFWFFGYSAILSIVLGIIGIVQSQNAKKAGFVGGIQSAGYILSLIGLIGGALFFVACVACVGLIGAASVIGAY